MIYICCAYILYEHAYKERRKIMKLKRKSGLIGAVIALSAASLVSVGFASWVISQGAKETISGTIAVDNVTDKSYEFTAWTNGTESEGTLTLNDNQRIIYGWAAYDATAAGHASYEWLTNTDELQGAAGVSSAENLSASFSFKIQSGEGFVGTAATSAAASLALNDGLGYAVSISAITPSKAWDVTAGASYGNLLGALEQPTLSYSEGVFTCNIKFSWGSYFTVGETVVNPMTYFNSKDPNAAGNENIATEAKNVLQAIDTYLTGMTYSLQLTIAKA